MKLKEFKNKLSKDYEAKIKEGLEQAKEWKEEPYMYFIDKAYEFAHYNEIIDFFDYMEEEDEDAEDYIEYIEELDSNDKRNYLDTLLYYGECNEDFNFFNYEDLRRVLINNLERLVGEQ